MQTAIWLLLWRQSLSEAVAPLLPGLDVVAGDLRLHAGAASTRLQIAASNMQLHVGVPAGCLCSRAQGYRVHGSAEGAG